MKSPFKDKPDTRLYSILPARAIQDDDLAHTTLRVLGALCLHSNGAGVCWPSRMTIGRHVNRKRSTITRHVSLLVKAGYVRRLKARMYPVKRKSKAGMTGRYQILFEGKQTKLPTKEEFFSALPKVVADIDDEPTPTEEHKERGVRGVDDGIHKRIVGAFLAGVQAVTGQHRDPDAQAEEARRLALAGIEPDQVREYTVEMCSDAQDQGRSAPLMLHQVAKWAGIG
jgi:hypothetical protein